MNATLPGAPWRERPGLDKLLVALGAGAGETRFVGGCVRDTLLGLEVSDVDLATRLTPEEVVKRLEKARIKAVPTGIAHGTITAVIQGWPVEVTTLRRDVATDGRRATPAYTDDWREDAARRDFTINALSADPASGALFDYFGGLADLEARRVRFIGDPLTRIAEDHLRILRFFRFHARFGADPPDLAGLDACAARANDLMALSRERIADELLKLLSVEHPAPTVIIMETIGIFEPIIPEIGEGGLRRLSGLCERERALGLDLDPIRRLAALLPVDPEIVTSVAARLRLSKRQSKRLISAAETSLDEPEMLAYAIGAEEAIDRFVLHAAEMPDLKALRAWQRPQLGIGGGDLIAMGLPVGPIVAKTLQAIERDWAREGFDGDKEAIRALARRHVDQALRSSQ